MKKYNSPQLEELNPILPDIQISTSDGGLIEKDPGDFSPIV